MVFPSVALISNIYLLPEDTLNDEPNKKYPTFNRELSLNNGEVTALDLIPPRNCAEYVNGILGYTVNDTKEGVWLTKYTLSPCWMKVVLVLLLKLEGLHWTRDISILDHRNALGVHLHLIRNGRRSCKMISLNYFCPFCFPEHKSTITTDNTFEISSDLVLCLFECLFSASLNA